MKSGSSELTKMRERLNQCRRADFFRLNRQIKQLSRQPAPDRLAALNEKIERSCKLRQQLQRNLPVFEYPEELPVSARRGEISTAIRNHQVTLICGETGSGKTTQLPKICLELGRGIDGVIGHTQPRRLAAQAVASRLAEELNTEVGSKIGYKVRFQDKVSEQSYIKLMTDGILLAEIQQDRWLNAYDTIIIDEAHERSLNIDFLLGYLKQLLPRRPDLKLIITSATIDAERIAAHFDNAPIIEISGRTWPVEIRYRPLQDRDSDDESMELDTAIETAIDELLQLGRGDILIFLPGEREIHEISHSLRHRKDRLDILPLYARLPSNEQKKIFRTGGRPRVILTTNVAETSLTVPGIRYVIDTGLARISRYSWRSKVQRLPIEKISQASANQRSGRCGRIGPGVCIRLFDEQDFNNRPEFTDAELLRTNLAAVILQMMYLRLGHIQQFPFIDKPDARLIRDGFRLLEALQAIDNKHQLTPTGKKIARLPIDPRLGRMLIAAADFGSLREVLIIVTALAAQDPRERPRNKQESSDESHKRFNDPDSDFLALVKLWQYLEQQFEDLSRSAFRKLCAAEYLSFRRWREWHDTHRQLLLALKDLGLKQNTTEASYEQIHQALLTGLLEYVGLREEKTSYRGCRNRSFLLFPGSGLRNKPPKWIMAAEITETTRLYGRTVARIAPEWIESTGKHLLKHQYSEPHWQQKSARVGGYDKITLNGLVINPKRKINYASIDPSGARNIFIRHALIYGEYITTHAVIQDNLALIQEIEEQEIKTRRRDILVDEDVLFDFYDHKIPEQITSGASFEKWINGLTDMEELRLNEKFLTREEADMADEKLFPSDWKQKNLRLPLTYHFEPGKENDGVTLAIPAGLLKQIDAHRCDWLIPGLLEEKILALIKSLPKALRKNFVPAPDFARAAFHSLTPYEGDLAAELSRTLNKMTGTRVPEAQWALQDIPAHLILRYEVKDDQGKTIAHGRDLESLRSQFSGLQQTRKTKKKALPLERDNIIDWNFGTLPESVECEEAGFIIERYPALTSENNHVSLRLYDTLEEARTAMPGGIRALIKLRLKQEIRYLDKNLQNIAQLCLLYTHTGSCQQLKQDIIDTAIQRSYLDANEHPRTQEDFNQLVLGGKSMLLEQANQLTDILGEILPLYKAVNKEISGNLPLSWVEAVADIKAQLNDLIYPGFLLQTPEPWLKEVPRYLKAILKRLEKLSQAPDKDRMRRVDIAPLQEKLNSIVSVKTSQEVFWLLQELRVSLFAQELGTIKKVSHKKVSKLLADCKKRSRAF